MNRVKIPLNILVDFVDGIKDDFGDSIPLELFSVSIAELEDRFVIQCKLDQDERDRETITLSV